MAAQTLPSSSYSADAPGFQQAGGRTWGQFGNACWTSMVNAWQCFDRTAGWLIGLDNSKYQWAVLEHQRMQREEEELIFNGSVQREQNQRMDDMEAQAPNHAPHQEVMMTAAASSSSRGATGGIAAAGAGASPSPASTPQGSRTRGGAAAAAGAFKEIPLDSPEERAAR